MTPGIVTLIAMVISNIGALIYTVARITTLLDVVQRRVEELTVELRAMRESYVSKEAFAYRLAQSDKEHEAMWKRIDEMQKLTKMFK